MANRDELVDSQLYSHLSLDNPKSFFLFAGAGSGKTRSLVNILSQFKSEHGRWMRLNGKQIGVITYTNAACDEIVRRLEYDSIFNVATIHSFLWSLIQGFNEDIRIWLKSDIENNINELEDLIKKGKKGTKVSFERERNIEFYKIRLQNLNSIKKFIYSPSGDNRTKGSLNHSEVIKIGADLIANKAMMQQILIKKFPFLLIDESQDTNKHLIDALMQVQAVHREKFGLGLFGDTMQRIYSDGKVGMGESLPPDWVKPNKVMNFRCPKRIVKLINQIRSEADTQVQYAADDATEGVVRLFIANANSTKKNELELAVRASMMKFTGDQKWSEFDSVKTLILEHHMAAKRMSFFEMYAPLSKIDEFKNGLRDGTLSFVSFFSDIVWPLIEAENENNSFKVASIVRKWSPLLNENLLKEKGHSQLHLANLAVQDLKQFFLNQADCTFIELARLVAKYELFEVPDAIKPFLEINEGSEDEESDDKDKILAIRKFLESPFTQIREYKKYVSRQAPFDTHQGVKGLEFQRVFVIADDEDAGGFLFSYDKLFGAKAKSDRDLQNESEGNETGIDRTRRLFYVTCSRSEQSLAVLIYSDRADLIKKHAIENDWFSESEIEVI